MRQFTFRSARFRAERLVAGRRHRERDLLAPVHLSLPDSRTLNLALPAPEGALRSAELRITQGARRFRVPLEREGRGLLTATATLREAPGPHPSLGEGVWRLTVVTTGTDGRVRRTGLALPAAPDAARPPSPMAPYAPDPATGTLKRVVRCRGGRAAVQVTRSRPRAELERFVPLGDGITVRGRLVAARPPGGEGLAVRRRDGFGVPVRVDWDGDRFGFRLPLARMAAAGAGQWVWDFRVGDLPVGRWLSGVRDPAAAWPTPFRVVALPGGGLVRAHPHFTGSGAFAVTCLSLTPTPEKETP
ncbi:hypothetical protein [Streptomyces sp. G45]|uniref:hypothetical protein n=1 Tax=Streptomyces sp. G45 TaxID=3406627 RepID=UPI003C2332E0